MPLDNKKISPETEEIIKGFPLDDETWKASYELPYQTKVMIYDEKCMGCGFMRIEVGDKVFNSLSEALDYAVFTKNDIIRTCGYPSDVQIINGKEIFPSLTEIVINTCQFWYQPKRKDG